jgi:hypothetical protein
MFAGYISVTLTEGDERTFKVTQHVKHPVLIHTYTVSRYRKYWVPYHN